MTDAPGAPGIEPTWASSDKDFVTAALGRSRLWATVGHGVLNEVYWPSTGRPRLRDLTFYLVHESGDGRWIDLKRRRDYTLSTPAPTVPRLSVRHEGEEGDAYALELGILPDNDRDALLITWSVEGPWRLSIIASPHAAAQGSDCRAWVDGELYATDGGAEGSAMCIATAGGFETASAGYVGISDGWQDLERNGRLTWAHASAGPGNVALSGALPGERGQIALAFAADPVGARTLARSLLSDETEAVAFAFEAAWKDWGKTLKLPAIKLKGGITPKAREAAMVSATVLKVHEDRGFPGAAVASLSVPWGDATDSLGGYHLVWPRDTVMTAFAFLALGQTSEARRTLAHLLAVQNDDGGWPQNYYPSGEPFWTGIQLDESALPILLAAKLRELGEAPLDGTDRMVGRAARYIARMGPSSPQDRWEENPGVNPYTLATMIAALIAAGPWLGDDAEAARDLALAWREGIDHWLWADRSRWSEVGHFIRVRPPANAELGPDTVRLRNRGGETIPSADLVAMDFAWLSRLGVLADDDPRVAATCEVVDAVLGVETPSGQVFHRYVSDGYGETAEGAPFTGQGIGRGWPFLAGERGHLALGLGARAEPYLATMLACRSKGGLMPEQVWDTDPVPEHGLEPGRPSGSAMPLLWTHAEFVKLLCAHAHGTPVERLDAVVAALKDAPPAPAWHWRDAAPVSELPEGRALIVECERPFVLHWGRDGWQDTQEVVATPGPFGLHAARIGVEAMGNAARIDFTRRFDDTWEGTDHGVRRAMPDGGPR